MNLLTLLPAQIDIATLAQFDIQNLIKSGTTLGTSLIAGVIGLLGIILVGVGVFRVSRKLWGSQQSQQQAPGWGKVAAMLIVGGAFIGGGIALVLSVAAGGQKTIEDLGTGGLALLGAVFGF